MLAAKLSTSGWHHSHVPLQTVPPEKKRKSCSLVPRQVQQGIGRHQRFAVKEGEDGASSASAEQNQEQSEVQEEESSGDNWREERIAALQY